MKGYVQWNPVYIWKDFLLQAGVDPGPLDQQASAWPIELLGLLLQNIVLRLIYSFHGNLLTEVLS